MPGTTTAAQLLLDARTRAGVSQAELARRSGIEQSTISRIEAGKIDPSWQTMQALLRGAGEQISVEPSPIADLIPATEAAKSIRKWSRRGSHWDALAEIAETVGRIRALGTLPAGGIPSWVTAEPPSTGNLKWDTALATGLAYALGLIGGKPEPWMLNAKKLPEPTLLTDDDPGDEYREHLRAQTPDIFLSKNLLTRDRDWAIA